MRENEARPTTRYVLLAIVAVACGDGDQLSGPLLTGGNREDIFDCDSRLCVVDVSVGEEHLCVLLDDGTVWCWGSNALGAVGPNQTLVTANNADASAEGDVLSPRQHTGLEHVSRLALGKFASCAIVDKSPSVATCWGAPLDASEVVTGSRDLGTPTMIPVDLVDLSVGFLHACLVRPNREVMCLGSNVNGQCGNAPLIPAEHNDGQTMARWAYAPVTVLKLGDAIDVGVSTTTSCAVLSDGTVACWGARGHTLLGPDASAPQTFTDSITPDVVPFDFGASTVALADTYACVLTRAQEVLCWGNMMLESEPGPYKTLWPPQKMAGVDCAVSISTGDTTTCAVSCQGEVFCWGVNTSGLLGTGISDEVEHLVAVKVPTISDAIAVSVGTYVACAVTRTGHLWCWGRNAHGMLGVGVADAVVYSPTEVTWTY